MNKFVRTFGFVSMTAMVLVLTACKNKDPSIMKVFVRNANNELVTNAEVMIVADVNSNPPTPEYVDKVFSNTSGFAQFDMAPFFDALGKDESTGYFDIYVTKNPEQGHEYTHARAHITTVETVYIE